MGEEANKEQVASPPRKSRAWIWWLVLLVCVLAVLGSAVALVFGWHEPKYSDKPLSYWLAELNGTNYIRRDIAADALAKIGEPALEPLKFALRKERSFVYELRDRVWKIAPLAIQQHIPKPWNVDDLQYNACVGIAAMGPQAAALVPDLVQVLTNTSPALVNRATYALNQIGTNAYPALLAGMKSSDPKLAAQCELILVRAGVVVTAAPIPPSPPKLSLYQIKFLEQFLNASEITVDEIKQTLKMFHPRSDAVVATLEEKLKGGSSQRRARVALLLANLFQSSELITQTMMENLEQLPEAERVGCACGLRYQGKHLQPYFDRLKKMAEDPSAQVAVQIVLLLEKEFGDSQPKWDLVDRIMGDASEEKYSQILILLYDNLRTGVDKDQAITCLRGMLNKSDEKLVATALELIARNPRMCAVMQAEVERLLAGLTENSKLKTQVEQVSRLLKLTGTGAPVKTQK